jgi:uncharacterized protein YndB with AHSA1/START domain
MASQTTLTVERSIDLDVSVEDLWRALTDPEELAGWFAPEAELDVREGGCGRFVDDEGVRRAAVVESVEAERRLVLRWWPDGDEATAASTVTLDVAPHAGGARLTVTEQLSAARRPDLAAVAEAAAAAWMWRLDMLLLRVAAAATARV